MLTTIWFIGHPDSGKETIRTDCRFIKCGKSSRDWSIWVWLNRLECQISICRCLLICFAIVDTSQSSTRLSSTLPLLNQSYLDLWKLKRSLLWHTVQLLDLVPKLTIFGMTKLSKLCARSIRKLQLKWCSIGQWQEAPSHFPDLPHQVTFRRTSRSTTLNSQIKKWKLLTHSIKVLESATSTVLVADLTSLHEKLPLNS